MPACAEQNPLEGLELELSIERIREVDDPSGIVRTVLDCARTDAATSCGQLLSVTAYRERLSLNVGDSFKLQQKTVVHETGDDISSILVLRDPNEKLLFLGAVGARPPLLDAELAPALSLSLDDSPLCRWQSDGALERVHLKSGDADCVIDSNTQRCCPILGQDMEVQIPSATSLGARLPQRLVNLALRAPGLFVAAGH